MKNKPLDFQSKTAEHIIDLFKRGQRRVLVADEAGLGKTTVASEVVRQVKQIDGVLDDNIYCIVYVCCNLQIAQQNIGTLSEEGARVDLSQSRLSMQHFVFHKEKAKLLAAGKDTLILSLTPATSFQMTMGAGSGYERALMYTCISLLDDFAPIKDKLSDIFVCKAYQSWRWLKEYYLGELKQDSMSEYREEVLPKIDLYLNKEFKKGLSYRDALKKLCSEETENFESESWNIVVSLRRVFADISLEVLAPDLVIMDEFQKFSSLIDINETAETEETIIAKKFFANKNLFVLLLSATPYKPYTTLEELNESNCDEQYEDFHRLMSFLFDGKNDVDYKRIWKEYSNALQLLSLDNYDSVKAKQSSAEDMLFSTMSRTERKNKGIVKQDLTDVAGALHENDIRSYIQMHELINECKKEGYKVNSAPIEYVKSAPYQLSFMDNYKMKEQIQEAVQNGVKLKKKGSLLLLDEDQIDNYRLVNYPNARLQDLINLIFGTIKEPTYAERLLWVPTSHPYYTQPDNVFSKNASFSKFLAFSSWGMVPKMIATLVSYECERRLYKKTFRNYTYNDDLMRLLKDDKKTKSLKVLSTTCKYLADLYDPENEYGKSIEDIKQRIGEQIQQKLNSMNLREIARVSSQDIFKIMGALDGEDTEVDDLPSNAVETLTNIAIAGPASCLYRIFRRIDEYKAKEYADKVARAMTVLFNNRAAVAAVRSTSKTYSYYFESLLDYCVQGNLQAVLDEFVHMIGETKNIDTLAARITESFSETYSQPVNSVQSFGTKEKLHMRKHYAVDFGSLKQDEKTIEHSVNVRSAFNSPFKPFVLVSTSVGQEGLDFHWYCRKIVHWNLPTNPQDLEQREGRVSRYKCLSVRRNLSRIYPNIFSWEDIFIAAKSDLKEKNPDMVPYWYLPLDNPKFDGIEKEYIERIVPLYPMSEDESRYQRLIGVLSLYRLTMGQPRQEELLDMIGDKIDINKLNELLFDLSPFSRDKKKENV